jgi:hypothetical protein
MMVTVGFMLFVNKANRVLEALTIWWDEKG